MKQCSLYSVLLLFALVVILLFVTSSNCYGYSFDEFLNYCELIKQYSTNTNNKNCANWIINNKTTIQSYLNSISDLNEYTTWYCCYQGSTSAYGGNMYLAMQKKGTAWNWNNAIKSTPATGWLIRRYGNGTSPTGNWQSGALQSANMSYYGTTTNYIGLIDEEQATTLNINFSGKEWNNFYQQYGTNYLEFDNALENTAYNGTLLTYYFQGDFYSSSETLLGNILPNDSYYFEVRLRDSVTGIVKGTSFVSLNTTPVNIYNDGALQINENFEVYAVNRLLKYSTQYQLEIESYYGDGGDNLYEDIDWFIFLPQNAVIDNGVITSLGSGDFTNQDVTNQIIDNNNENFMNTIDFYQDDSQVNTEIDAMFSGDTNEIVSGLNFPNLENNYFVVIYNAVTGITDTLQMSGDPYFDISLHGETPKRIYASDFTTPPSVLKTFISMSMVFGTIYCLYLQLSGFINLLNTGHVKDAINQIDDISGATIYKM